MKYKHGFYCLNYYNNIYYWDGITLLVCVNDTVNHWFESKHETLDEVRRCFHRKLFYLGV